MRDTIGGENVTIGKDYQQKFLEGKKMPSVVEHLKLLKLIPEDARADWKIDNDDIPDKKKRTPPTWVVDASITLTIIACAVEGYELDE